MCILSRRLLSTSLPASLTTDCGGLLNRSGPGRKRCCHTDALHAGYHVYFSNGLFLSRIIELVYFHTEHRGESRFYCPGFANCRIFLHTDGRGGHGLFTRVFFLSRIIEFANWFIFTRSIADGHGFIVPRLVLWTH